MKWTFFMLRAIGLALLVVLAGCTKDTTYQDAVEAIARFREFRTKDAQLEAKRAFDVANRSITEPERSLLSDVYYSASWDVVIGGPGSHETADVCEAEAKGADILLQVYKHQRGDCKKMMEEHWRGVSKEAEEALAKWDARKRPARSKKASK
jgi:hypothetical protein